MDTRSRTCAVVLSQIERQSRKPNTGVARARVRHEKTEHVRTIAVAALLALATAYEISGSLFVTAVVGVTTIVLVHGLTGRTGSGSSG